MQEVVERAQQRRDLRAQLDGIAREDESEIVFKETSPARRMHTIYSMVNGEPISIPRALVDRTLQKRQPNGQFMFTGRKEEAPEYKLGAVKCFLHPESPYRLSGALDEAGIGGFSCDSAHLASKYAMEEVAKTKHRKQWAALESYLMEQKADEQDARQQAQLEATLALAGQASKTKREGAKCPECNDYFVSKAHRAHKE